MATLPYFELPHLVLGVAAIAALAGSSVAADPGDADERLTVDRSDAAPRRLDARTANRDIDTDAE